MPDLDVYALLVVVWRRAGEKASIINEIQCVSTNVYSFHLTRSVAVYFNATNAHQVYSLYGRQHNC